MQTWRQFGHFVQEQNSPGGPFDAAYLVRLQILGEGRSHRNPLRRAEQLESQHILRYSVTRHRRERLRASATHRSKHTGKHFLADSRFAMKQER